MIERERPADNRRMVRVGITDAGLQLVRDMEADVRQCHERQLGHLEQADLDQLIALLRAARRPHEADDSSWL